MLAEQLLIDRIQRLNSFAILNADAGHDTHSLWLNEDLTFFTDLGSHWVAEVIVGA
ncbi:hypothetical protein SDC9_190274 [bioreactor metagenome]|uniref:Uncharacterized protein n=1 Tax=bioreactor metagenome TaxID=1076179 RepID=A0A645HUS1_9ZZZZ